MAFVPTPTPMRLLFPATLVGQPKKMSGIGATFWATIVLDTRASAHTPETFEQAVSAAASIIVSCAHRRYLLRLVTTSGGDTGSGEGAAHIERILEELATVEPDPGGDIEL